MAKVHPNAVAPEPGTAGATGVQDRAAAEPEPQPPTVLTVWRKSLLFNCDGFTVYDASGDLAFRVDCYAGSRTRRRSRLADDDVVLMDATGKPLLTVRRKTRLGGLAERCWVIYDGDAADAGNRATPLLSVSRQAARSSSTSCKTLARVATPGAEAAAAAYVVEGSYGKRACAVLDAARGGAVVAEVQRKEAVGDDVFRLVVPGPRLGAPLAMALVIALDDMFRSSRADAGAGG